MISVLAVLAGLVLWYLAALVADPLFLPNPVKVAVAGAQLVADGTLQHDILSSLARVYLGWLLGACVAVPVGLAAGATRIGRALIDPFLHFMRFVPAIALVGLFLVWFGVGEVSKVLLVAYATAFLVMVNTATGAAAIPEDKLNAGRCLGASRLQSFRKITIPAAVPSIYVSMRLSLGVAFLVIVAAESLAANSGIGYMIWTSRLFFRTDWTFVGIILLGALGFLSDRSFRYLTRVLMGRYVNDSAKY